MVELRFCFALKFRDDALRKNLSQLDAPLVERINIPNCTLCEDGVFVKCHQFAQGFRCQSFSQDRVRRTIALEDPVRDEPLWCAFSLHLFGGLTKCQRLGLRADIGDQHVMMPAERIERLRKSDEVARDEPGSLMNQLVERVLTVGSRFAPVDGTGLVAHSLPVERDMLAIAFHRQLLKIGWKPFQILLIRQDSDGLRTKKVVVPESQETHEYWQVLFKGSGAEVLVHLMKTTQHRAEVFRSDRHDGREADGRGHRVATADPVPELEHVGSINAELRNFCRVG